MYSYFFPSQFAQCARNIERNQEALDRRQEVIVFMKTSSTKHGRWVDQNAADQIRREILLSTEHYISRLTSLFDYRRWFNAQHLN